jgi:hypothetical protein
VHFFHSLETFEIPFHRPDSGREKKNEIAMIASGDFSEVVRLIPEPANGFRHESELPVRIRHPAPEVVSGFLALNDDCPGHPENGRDGRFPIGHFQVHVDIRSPGRDDDSTTRTRCRSQRIQEQGSRPEGVMHVNNVRTEPPEAFHKCGGSSCLR